MIKRVEVQDERKFPRNYLVPGQPYHVHHCSGPGAHDWNCSSPYCSNSARMCPAHGGKHPRGLEDPEGGA